ncbi:xanthine dehydrogenase family protein molybdopterin-binding subunit [uncultured Jannaschia sp.]|uniref:xanthine dehydrogenase family protein molybdopterin-binding subunit n=1 Tax=uncultured Jannaschia sp. TaxID=293347 RepID=UPI002613F7E6|nr:xanthine dehydrogenase family protein molybdopterin-binding subunit [uncultured Jannaschia sp.]
MHPLTKLAFAPTPSRRSFLTGSAGLILGLHLAGRGRAQSAPVQMADGSFAPNAFIRVSPDNTVTVLVKHIEIGQGANTGLPILVAEEMDADWSQMRAEQAPSDPVIYANTAFGIQGTGGSTGLSNSYMTMRQAGAAARAMLVSAAADDWGVAASGITVEKGVVAHAGSGRSATFGELAEAAARAPVPVDVALKDLADFTLVGGEGVMRLDSEAKTKGTAQFTIDVFRDGMQVVAMAHPPKFGATVASVDDASALAVAGVSAVRPVPSGVAVYADNTFAAFKGRDALVIEWDESGAEIRSSEQMIADFSAALRDDPLTFEESGDLDGALEGAAQVLEAEYVFPYLAHAAMEPLDGVIELTETGAEIWSGMQIPTTSQGTMAAVLGLDQSALAINTMYTGGSFGRRATPDNHFAAELANVAKAAGPGAYKLVWTRENDMRGGYYRPLTIHSLRGGLDADGNIVGWENNIANQSIIAGSAFEMMMQDGLDPTAFEGSNHLPYDLGATRMGWKQVEAGVPVLWWRSVGHTHTGYAVETFLDQLLVAGGKDPVQGRLDLMKGDRPRDRAVLERVAEMAGWDGPGSGDRRMGVAVVRSFGSYVAQIAEVEDRGTGVPNVTRVWCAIDCGLAVTPDVVRAQMEGGIGYGLGSMLFDEITLGEGGVVQQSNYDDYRILRLNEMPQIEVAILDSPELPTGVGEPGTPPIAPAVANALRALIGTMPTRLPFRANSV